MEPLGIVSLNIQGAAIYTLAQDETAVERDRETETWNYHCASGSTVRQSGIAHVCSASALVP